MNDNLMNPDQGFMSYEQFVEVAEQIRGVRRLYLSHGGESLLHPRFTDMARYIGERRIARSFGIETNGILLTPGIADELFAAGITIINISLDAADAVTNASLRVGSSFDTIVKNIRYVAANAPEGCRVEIFSVLTAGNVEGIANMPALLHDLGVKHYRTMQLIIRNEEMAAHRISLPPELLSLLKKQCGEYGIEYRHYANPSRTYCYQPFKEMSVTWDGKITPCCPNKTTGMNETPYDLTNMWNGPAIRALRHDMVRRRFTEKCLENCDIAGG